jgi:hypothetical protein
LEKHAAMKAFGQMLRYIWPQWPRIIVVVLSAVAIAAMLVLGELEAQTYTVPSYGTPGVPFMATVPDTPTGLPCNWWAGISDSFTTKANLKVKTYCVFVSPNGGAVRYLFGGKPTRNRQVVQVLAAAADTNKDSGRVAIKVTTTNFRDSMYVRLSHTKYDTANNFRPYLITKVNSSSIVIKANYAAETMTTADTAWTPATGEKLQDGEQLPIRSMDWARKFFYENYDSGSANIFTVNQGVN